MRGEPKHFTSSKMMCVLADVGVDLVRHGLPLLRPLGVLADLGQPRSTIERHPAQGVRVQRIPSVTRWLDGTTFAWISRRVGAGAGEGSSGLQFDVAGVPPASD